MMRGKRSPGALRPAWGVLAVLLAACASRATPLALPAGHPADPDTPGTAAPAQPPPHPEPGAPMRPEPDAAQGYVCPMHPEVTSPAPGTCPKCGMALVRARHAEPGERGHEEHR